MNAARAVASGRWVASRRLGRSYRRLRWVFQTSRSIWRIDSVSGRTRSLFRLPMTRRTICFESTAETGSVTVSVIVQAIGVDERDTAAINGLFQCGDQAPAVVVTADVGQPLPPWLADFIFVNRGQSVAQRIEVEELEPGEDRHESPLGHTQLIADVEEVVFDLPLASGDRAKPCSRWPVGEQLADTRVGSLRPARRAACP